MFRRLTTRRILATTLGGIAAIGAFAGLAFAQQNKAPMFFDARRLPDMEVERRNQEVLQEQRRVAEERRQEAEATSKRKIDEARLAAEADRKAAAETARADEARLAADAQRKADDEKRVAAEADAKKKAEEVRLAEIADATQRKAEEDKRALAEADAKKKADEEARLAALAEVQRKADEDKRAAVELEAKKKADEVRLAAVAEAQRKADEEKRSAAEADAKKTAEATRLAAVAEAQRKSDEERTAAADATKKAEESRLADAARKADEERKLAVAHATPPAQPQTQPQTTALLAPPATNELNPASPTSCDAAKISTQPLMGGRMQVMVDSPCRKGQAVTVKYGSYDFVRKLDANGRSTIIVDLFLGKGEGVKLNYADGRDDAVAPVASDLNEVSKVALIWQSPVDLDLHAFENGAVTGKSGHVWPGSAGSVETAKAQMNETGRGAGFISTAGDGQGEGTKIEVYTWFHSPEQDTGAVTMAVDYASRGDKPAGDKCGQGPLAEIPFDVVITNSKGKVQTESGLIPAAKCGETLAANARYLRGIVPDLKFRR